MFLLLGGALALEHDALKFFKNWELLVRVINLGVTLFFRDKKTDFFETLQLALNITGIFFDKLSQTSDMRLEVWVLSVDDNNLPPNS